MNLVDRKLNRTSVLILSLLILSCLALAEGTRTWEQSKFDDLTRGTANGIAFRSEGGLELAPAFKTLATTPSTYIWSIASDSAGNIYAAAGAPARVYRVAPDGKTTTIFEPQELQVQALVAAKNGIVFAATAPDGKVYRLAPPSSETASWSASLYFDPGAKYIWDLALDNSGNLYVATGDHGEIFKVAADGKHSVFFKSDEVHIRVLALDPKGNLIAGSDGSGLVYRISPAGEAFVLYSAPKKEITALAIDGAGNIYAAGAGEKHPSPSDASSSLPSTGAQQTLATAGGTSTIVVTPSSATPFSSPAKGVSGGSEIYRIAPDGAPEQLWSSHDDLVYALGFDQHGRLLAGTGNRGHIFAINGAGDFTDLVRASASQITSFAAAPGGGLYASSSNLGKIFLLGPATESEGSYESDVFDAHIFSRWGRATMRSSGNVALFARSGNVDNPDRNWSPWMPVAGADAEMKVPAARFVQWKSVLHAGTTAPRVDSVLLYYLPKNVAPQIEDVTAQPGYRYPAISHTLVSDLSSSSSPHIDLPPPQPVRDRDSVAVHWTAHDDNDDQLVFSIYYRGDNESRWLLLKDGVSDRFYTFDANLLPDGGYTMLVVASDAPSHSPGEALFAQKTSPRFEVDNTSPTIEVLTAVLEGKQIHVRFRAKDSFSNIKRAEYSLDGSDWQFVEPASQLSDSKIEDYDFRIPVPQAATPPPLTSAASNDHVVVVRAYDRFDNLATAKTLLRGQ